MNDAALLLMPFAVCSYLVKITHNIELTLSPVMP